MATTRTARIRARKIAAIMNGRPSAAATVTRPDQQDKLCLCGVDDGHLMLYCDNSLVNQTLLLGGVYRLEIINTPRKGSGRLPIPFLF